MSDVPATYIPKESDVVICCMGGCLECGTPLGIMVQRNVPLGLTGIKHGLPTPYPCRFVLSASVA
jgi:hypothetical protein